MKKFIKLLSVSVSLALCFCFGISKTDVYAKENIKSKSAYLYDFNTNTEIYAYNENQRLPIASMTKIMLLDLVYENLENDTISLDEIVTVSENASGMGGSQVFLESGGNYSVSNLIKSVTVASANDASVALAERLYGSEEECVKKMNEKAEALGLKNTRFSNCTGLPKPMQYSSAKDITLIFADLISHPTYFNFSKIWLDKIEHSKNSTEITNTNKLVKFYNGCDGGKTGFTSEAGFCLTATAKRGNMRLISAVIGAPDSKTRFNEVSTMFNNGFNQYENIAVLDKNLPLDFKINVLGGKIKSIEVLPEEDFFVFSKKGETANVTLEYDCYKVKAPIKKGEVVGQCSIFNNGIEVGKVNLVSTCCVNEMNYFNYLTEIAKNW